MGKSPEYVTPEYLENETDFVYGKVLKPNCSPDDEFPSVYDVFCSVADFKNMLHFITVETNRYAVQNGR